MLNKIMFQDANCTQIRKPPVLVFERAQFSLLSDFPRNIDTCQRKQTCSARLIGKNSAEGSSLYFLKCEVYISNPFNCTDVLLFYAFFIAFKEKLCSYLYTSMYFCDIYT